MPTNPCRTALALSWLVCAIGAPTASPYTMEQVKGHPFPTQLTAAATGSRIAWAFNEKGLRNVWTAEGPQFTARRLTSYLADDGQEITSLQVSADGRYVVYVRGGDHGSNQDASVAVNPASSPTASKVQVWSIPWEGGEPKLLGDGDEPAVSPLGDRVAFVKERQVWIAPIDGSAPARLLASPRGESGGLQWSPDGSRLAFVSDRGEHSVIGVVTTRRRRSGGSPPPRPATAARAGRPTGPAWPSCAGRAEVDRPSRH